MNIENHPVLIEHNFDPRAFQWLWAKYVKGVNDTKHCTHAVRGPYSKKFSKHNPNLLADGKVLFDEEEASTFRAIYICGVAKNGYTKKQNYPHNVNLAIQPVFGEENEWSFENWRVKIRNGRMLTIPPREALPEKFAHMDDEFVTCRIFRWAVTTSLFAK